MLKTCTMLSEFLKKLVYSKMGVFVIIATLVLFLLGCGVSNLGSKLTDLFSNDNIPALKSEISLKDSVIENLLIINKEKDVDIKMTDVLHQQEVKTFVEVVKKEKKIDRVISQVKTQVGEKVQVITHSELTEEQKVVEESIVLVDSIWEVYCEVEPNCKKELTS